MLILGTAYDIYLRNERQRITRMKNKKESQIGITYDLTGGNIKKNEIPALSVGIQAGQNNNNNSDENLAVESVSEEDKKLCK